MDLKLKQLLVKLSTKYKIRITNYMFYDDEESRFINSFTAKIYNKSNNKPLGEIECFGKSNLIRELMKWLE